jgi:diguanylate cyclase (GGDEF)-like protein
MERPNSGGIAPVAARSTLVGSWALMSVAGVLAVSGSAGTLLSTRYDVITGLHWVAAGFAVCAGMALLWSGFDRARREGRRRRFVWLFTFGGSIWLFGQAIGYVLLAEGADTFDPRIETIPLMIGLPLTMVGAIGLTAPAAMDRRDVHDASVDAALGVISLMVVWGIAVVPNWAPVAPEMRWVTRLDQLLLMLACMGFVVMISFGRKPGTLALPQLALFVGGMTLVVISDLVGEFGPDRDTEVTVSLAGYWLGITLVLVMLHRSAAELEPPRMALLRTSVAVGVPFALVTIAGLLLITLAQDALPNSQILRVMPVIWVVVAVITAISRASWQRLDRTRRHARSTSELAASAEFGWISAMLGNSSEYVFVIDVSGVIVYCSPRSKERLAATRTLPELVCDPNADLPTLLSAVLAGAVPAGPYDMVLQGVDGSQREVMVYLRTIREVSFEGFVVTGTDVTDTRRLVEQLDLTHRHDALTGLLTHDAFIAEVAAAQQGGVPLGVAVLDINDLGVWNETLGRSGGDAILQAVALYFDTLPAEVTAVGRIAGDGFGLLVVSTAPGQVLESVLDRLTTALRGLLLPDDREVDVTFRAGYAVTSNGSDMPAQKLLDEADVALRRARSSRRSSIVRFRPGMNDDLVRRLTGEQRIREALAGDGIEVHYQPIMSLSDESVPSMEALVRLRTPDGGLLMPGAFIAAAEYSGLVREVDHRVRQLVAQDWETLAASTWPKLRINVNVHEMELTPALADELLQAHLAHKVVVEVTEAALLTRPGEAAATLEAIRAGGGLVAIDDFGTGYSSLSQIMHLPCDLLKIDRSFIAAMTRDPRTMSLVRATIGLAHDLGLLTVAEGVETIEEVAALRAMGCDRVQGFWFSQPLPVAELVPWLGSRAA